MTIFSQNFKKVKHLDIFDSTVHTVNAVGIMFILPTSIGMKCNMMAKGSKMIMKMNEYNPTLAETTFLLRALSWSAADKARNKK